MRTLHCRNSNKVTISKDDASLEMIAFASVKQRLLLPAKLSVPSGANQIRWTHISPSSIAFTHFIGASSSSFPLMKSSTLSKITQAYNSKKRSPSLQFKKEKKRQKRERIEMKYSSMTVLICEIWAEYFQRTRAWNKKIQNIWINKSLSHNTCKINIKPQIVLTEVERSHQFWTTDFVRARMCRILKGSHL